MAAADMASWRRQNSDAIAVELQLVDGSVRKGRLLVSRDKSLRDTFNVPGEAFVDFDCRRDGPIVLAKASVRIIRVESEKKSDDQTKIDALAARKAELDKLDPYKFLGVSSSVDSDGLHKAYIAMARTYHPDRYADTNLPPEILDYLNAMARRINGVYEELADTQETKEPKK